MTRVVRFALVGAGAISAAYEAAFALLGERARIVAVVDVSQERANATAQRLGCEAFASIDEAVDALPFDAAIICTPPSTHELLACRLLAAGKHVLCEKPLATSVASAHRMLDAARDAGCLLTMASKFRYVKDVQRAHALVRDGAIGELVFVENAFTSCVDMRNRWNADKAVSGGGVLIDNGTHSVDILRYFLGSLRDIQVVEGRRIQTLAVEDTARLFVHNDAGVVGTADLSWSINKDLPSFLRLYGASGTIEIGWRESRMRIGNEWSAIGNGYDKQQAFCDQIRNFCNAIDGEDDLFVTPRDALASVEVIQAAYAALDEARWHFIESQIEEIATTPRRPAEVGV